MKINPTTLSWKAPTENEDNTPIDYELGYEVGVKAGDTFMPIYATPGSLNPDGNYEAPIEAMNFQDGVHTIAMRAFRADSPSVMSKWSNELSFEIENDRPNAPFDIAVA